MGGIVQNDKIFRVLFPLHIDADPLPLPTTLIFPGGQVNVERDGKVPLHFR